MQMTSGNASTGVSHWANMLPITPADPEWTALSGYLTTGVPDLTGKQMVERVGKTRAYRATQAGLKAIAALVLRIDDLRIEAIVQPGFLSTA
jgi:hypothetical protein